jgi:hypothetical protein
MIDKSHYWVDQEKIKFQNVWGYGILWDTMEGDRILVDHLVHWDCGLKNPTQLVEGFPLDLNYKALLFPISLCRIKTNPRNRA